MKRQQLITALLAAGTLLAACSPAPDISQQESEQLQQQAAGLAGQFVNTLQPTLQQAMQAGGPVNAIQVCAEAAPAIADRLSAESGWNIRRVSLKARNAGRAIPDDWEREQLARFNQRQESGEAGADLHVAGVVDGEYRYMQAQAAAPLCLTCHGSNISSEVSAALSQYYPDDRATGYSAGQIRGAISLRKEL